MAKASGGRVNLSPISAEEVRNLLREGRRIVFLDATCPDVWVASEGRIRRLPPYEAPQLEVIGRDATIVTYTGAAVEDTSARLSVALRQQGWVDVRSLGGGYAAWRDLGFKDASGTIFPSVW